MKSFGTGPSQLGIIASASLMVAILGMGANCWSEQSGSMSASPSAGGGSTGEVIGSGTSVASATSVADGSVWVETDATESAVGAILKLRRGWRRGTGGANSAGGTTSASGGGPGTGTGGSGHSGGATTALGGSSGRAGGSSGSGTGGTSSTATSVQGGSGGLGTTTGGGSGGSLPSSSGGASAGSSGCTSTGQATGDRHLSTKDGSGTMRNFEVLVPTSYPAGSPLSVTFVFHGAGGSEKDAKSMGLQSAAGASSSSIFVFPQGIAYQGYGVGWNDLCGGYDMVFFDNMLSAIKTTYCVDPKRVFVAGFSWGGDFVTALTCCRGNQIRGVSAASCSDEFSNPADYKTYANYPCPTQSAASIRFTHDAHDDGAYTAQMFATTSQLFRTANVCSSSSSATSPSPCVSYANCSHPFVECSYPGLGHTLPSNWANDTWSFFSQIK